MSALVHSSAWCVLCSFATAMQVSRASSAEAAAAMDTGAEVTSRKRARDPTDATTVMAELPRKKRVRFVAGTNFEAKVGSLAALA